MKVPSAFCGPLDRLRHRPPILNSPETVTLSLPNAMPPEET